MSCTFGFYQPKYGQITCLPCPANTTTQNRGSITINECINLDITKNDICYTKPCLNDGQCLEKEDEDYICECRDYYVGKNINFDLLYQFLNCYNNFLVIHFF